MKFSKVKNILAIAFVSITVGLHVSCKEDKPVPSKKLDIKFKKEGVLKIVRASNDSILKTIDIEIADNDYERETGLMYRSTMENNQGMLFIFEDEQYLAFYMKNTMIPLDILYINANNTIVDIYKSTTPYNDKALPSKSIAKYVLELKAGLADEWQIEVGDSISYSVLD
ncbi:DUF192 domain-containing protein [Paucihalobacter sp.]|uniref:DUF192 domain-containing protein n=1 Tax=Paucihalobacter sp. TaxID=2850405 RepID=UPI002FDF421C